MPSDSNNIFGFFDEFEASEGESQQPPIELFQEPVEILSTLDSQPKKVQQEVFVINKKRHPLTVVNICRVTSCISDLFKFKE
ncbi:hypothetical protein CWN94_18560 [Vibrio splendidus]|nr:hypothetical protein A134_18635 [Vibrio crassostreae 9CS106]PTO52217.1 hypothetical protein CWN94_18560 [Vibrio splendidus]PTO64593.1 hypothetical protein CWN99_10785 [Vibrio splendidus]PTO87867.1 hypothetical protein CWO29_16205 [Vibrio splendidus]PTP46079.1 hypothetical protein CWN87_02930 [Vibrio splendidus]